MSSHLHISDHVKVAVITSNQLEEDNLPPRGKIMYLILHAESSMKMLAPKVSDRTEEQVDHVLEAITSAVELSQVELNVCDPLRLLAVYTYCKVISELNGEYAIAKSLAEEAFSSASALSNSLDASAIKLLQRLRDDFMCLSESEIRLLSRLEHTAHHEHQDEEIAPDTLAVEGVDLASGTTRPGIALLRGLSAAQLNVSDNGNAAPVVHIPNYQLVKRIRNNISLDFPIRLENLSSAIDIIPALDYIFRVYVRGNSLPGQQFGSQFVHLGDNKLSLGKFLLQGPYISWKGFLEVVKDFKLAQLPNKKTKYGHKFYTNWDPSFKLYNEAYFYLHDAPLTMRDIAVIFIESSKTSTPALVLTKYLKTHYEDVYKRNLAATASHKDDFISSAPGHTKIGRETIASSAHHSPMKDTTESFNLNNASNADTRESNHRSSMGVPWDEIVDWMDKDESWDVVNGLNFVQFVDCLAKCGILAYSSAKFNDVLQNPVEKVEHFFIAHLGLAGSSTGRTDWKAKADARLIAIKSKIKSTYGKNFTATTTTA